MIKHFPELKLGSIQRIGRIFCNGGQGLKNFFGAGEQFKIGRMNYFGLGLRFVVSGISTGR
jgi:hypothetical protein